MGYEIDLLANYPKAKRNIEERKVSKSDEDRFIARKFGKEFFDGERRHGYGGFIYHPKFWQPVIPSFQNFYKLSANSKILDIGCAKGFMLYDFTKIIPGIEVRGIDISEYAIDTAKEEIKPFVQVADIRRRLPFEDRSFDLVVSINTLHNLARKDLIAALRELARLSKGNSFITVDAYRNEEEKALMEAWNLTAQTVLHVDEWKALFDEAGYHGDYYWFIP